MRYITVLDIDRVTALLARFIGPLLDKLLFGVTLLLALQVPQLADHYQQFLSGWLASTQWQVEGYAATAKKYGYPNTRLMIEQHRRNSEASVRADAEQKWQTLEIYKELQQATTLFREGNLLSKSIYMFTPSHFGYLEKTLENFKPGIPLTLEGISFGVIAGLLLNLFISLPLIFVTKKVRGLFRPERSQHLNT